MSSQPYREGVVPAYLSFLAIYNPTLSFSDETAQDQIVYYYSKERRLKKASQKDADTDPEGSKEQINERLRNVGLAQGMVQFAREFSDGTPVDSVDSERARIVLHNLEENWWLLASVDLTKISTLTEASSSKDGAKGPTLSVEYSSREVSPPALLLQQLVRAHQIFLLHQSPSLSELWAKAPRRKFCSLLKQYWDPFIWTWDVLLHGNPAVDIYNGLKLSAGGELGIGTDEEEWGSGEREVLEGFIGRTEGLVDLVVSRFEDITKSGQVKSKGIANEDFGSGEYPEPSDGVIFSGVGALTRTSVRNLSAWVECLSIFGNHAFGVRENPSSVVRRKKRGRPQREDVKGGSVHPNEGIPAPIVSGNKKIPKPAASRDSVDGRGPNGQKAQGEDYATSSETMVKYLTLGIYGSTWGIPSGRPTSHQRVSALREDEKAQNTNATADSVGSHKTNIANGFFMVGLKGDLEEEEEDDGTDEGTAPTTEAETDGETAPEREAQNKRIVIRTLFVERTSSYDQRDPRIHGDDSNANETFFARLRVVVYVQPPFVFTMLFETETYSLLMPSFYRSLHHQLGPLQQPLQTCTSPPRVRERLKEAMTPRTATPTNSVVQTVSNLVYDPGRLTIYTTIPNIPEAHLNSNASNNDPAPSAAWTRAEAMTVHSQILNTYISTRRERWELERTCKTGRGWWVVWMRLPHSSPLSNSTGEPHHRSREYREAFLIRKASDYVPPTARKGARTSGRFISGGARSAGDASGWGAGKLVEGIGIDARQYIDGLLSLSR